MSLFKAKLKSLKDKHELSNEELKDEIKELKKVKKGKKSSKSKK